MPPTMMVALVGQIRCRLRARDSHTNLRWIDLGLKKKKKKAKKDTDDEFAAKLAALDIEKEGEDEPAEQEGDMCVGFLCTLLMGY